MTKLSEPMTRTITIGEKELKFDQRVAVMIELEDRFIIRLKTADFDYGDPMVGRNILCYDLSGELLWRVEDSEMTIGEKNTPQSFLGLYLEDDGKIEADNPDAVFCISPENGEFYDGVRKGKMG